MKMKQQIVNKETFYCYYNLGGLEKIIYLCIRFCTFSIYMLYHVNCEYKVYCLMNYINNLIFYKNQL